MTYILPILNYGAEVMMNSSDSVVKKLEKIQNKALRIITGAIKTTPITAMEMTTGIKPLKFLREATALKTFERILRTPNCLFNNYKPSENRLKSKISFIDHVKILYENYELTHTTKVKKITLSKKTKDDKNFKLVEMYISGSEFLPFQT